MTLYILYLFIVIVFWVLQAKSYEAIFAVVKSIAMENKNEMPSESGIHFVTNFMMLIYSIFWPITIFYMFVDNEG